MQGAPPPASPPPPQASGTALAQAVLAGDALRRALDALVRTHADTLVCTRPPAAPRARALQPAPGPAPSGSGRAPAGRAAAAAAADRPLRMETLRALDALLTDAIDSSRAALGHKDKAHGARGDGDARAEAAQLAEPPGRVARPPAQDVGAHSGAHSGAGSGAGAAGEVPPAARAFPARLLRAVSGYARAGRPPVPVRGSRAGRVGAPGLREARASVVRIIAAGGADCAPQQSSHAAAGYAARQQLLRETARAGRALTEAARGTLLAALPAGRAGPEAARSGGCDGPGPDDPAAPWLAADDGVLPRGGVYYETVAELLELAQIRHELRATRVLAALERAAAVEAFRALKEHEAALARGGGDERAYLAALSNTSALLGARAFIVPTAPPSPPPGDEDEEDLGCEPSGDRGAGCDDGRGHKWPAWHAA